MTTVSNDSSWWPVFNFDIFYSYWLVATGIMVVYDWVITLGQEIELIWICYIGIPYSVINALSQMTPVSMTDVECNIMNYVINLTNVVMAAMLGVTVVIALDNVVGVWEVLALCLSVWVAVKHFRDLRQLGPLTGSTIGDCFKVLIKSHVLYFASFVGISCFQFIFLSPEFVNSQSMETEILYGAFEILLLVQMFVLGPRLILSVREYHAKLVAQSDADTSMDSIVFEERIHVPTSSTV
ncbi:hypothetical protein BD769DRAFT_1392590 [Suillus cothurnatus]|nr:hypothetical protein BD769DRAFT_1392590 [Suillus cothurnatus]